MSEEREPVRPVALGELHDDAACMVRVQHAQEVIERYKDVWLERPGEMEPILVNERRRGGRPDGYDIIAGYGRVTAARLAGLTHVPARVVRVSTKEAVLLACQSNARHGQPMTAEDVAHALRLLVQHHPELSSEGLARAVGRSVRVVNHFLRGERVRRALAAARLVHDLHQAVLDEIGAAPEEYWVGLGRAAAQHRWTKYDARAAVENLSDERLGAAAKAQLLDGHQKPVPLPAFAGRAVARALPDEVVACLSPQHLVAIEEAPPRYWEDLAANAADGEWSVELTGRMAKSLRTMSPEQAAEALRDPAVPHRPAEEGPEKGTPMVALESVLKQQGPAHLDPNRARAAIRHLFTAMGAASRFDPDMAMGAFGTEDWDDLAHELATLVGLAMDLQAALDRVREGRPRVVAGR